MLLSLWKNGLTSLFKEVRVFKVASLWERLLVCYGITETARIGKKSANLGYKSADIC